MAAARAPAPSAPGLATPLHYICL